MKKLMLSIVGGVVVTLAASASLGLWKLFVGYLTADYRAEVVELRHRLDMADYAREQNDKWMRRLHWKLDETRRMNNMSDTGVP